VNCIPIDKFTQQNRFIDENDFISFFKKLPQVSKTINKILSLALSRLSTIKLWLNWWIDKFLTNISKYSNSYCVSIKYSTFICEFYESWKLIKLNIFKKSQFYINFTLKSLIELFLCWVLSDNEYVFLYLKGSYLFKNYFIWTNLCLYYCNTIYNILIIIRLF
jgi:hypothetical protein